MATPRFLWRDRATSLAPSVLLERPTWASGATPLRSPGPGLCYFSAFERECLRRALAYAEMHVPFRGPTGDFMNSAEAGEWIVHRNLEGPRLVSEYLRIFCGAVYVKLGGDFDPRAPGRWLWANTLGPMECLWDVYCGQFWGRGPVPAVGPCETTMPMPIDHCDDQYQRDSAYCRSLEDPTSRRLCWERAAQDYGDCIARRPVP